MAMVGVVALHFVSRVLPLRGCGGCHVAVMFVVWPRWVLSCRVVLRLGLLRCVVVVGVIVPCGTTVIGPQKRKLAEKREKKKRKMHQRVRQRK
jgi:hypothetical protein